MSCRISSPALLVAAEHVVVTAHLDHVGIGEPVGGDAIYNGYYDNAMGSAVLLEAARRLAAAPAGRSRRSIVFALVTGLFTASMGAAHLLADLRHEPLLEWIRPNQVAPYPAAVFLLSGLALLSILFMLRWVALVAGAVVTGAGALTLIAYQRGIELGFPLTAFGTVTEVKAYSPGRITPNVAVSFVLIGIACVLKCGLGLGIELGQPRFPGLVLRTSAHPNRAP